MSQATLLSSAAPAAIAAAETGEPKFFRILVEGDTVDGRKVTAQDILDIAHTYVPDTYAARVNMDHIRGTIPGGPFDRLGDVLAVRAQQDTLTIGGGPQKRQALYAQIKPLPALIELAKAGQKVFTSAEIDRNFASTGKTGLLGLAVTDDPASLGTHRLAFSAQHGGDADAEPSFASRTSMFTAYRETELDFSGVAPADPDGDAGADSVVNRIIAGLGKLMGFSVDPAPEAPAAPAPAAPAPVIAPEPAAPAAAPAVDLGSLFSTLLANPAALALAGRAVDLFDKLSARIEAAPAAGVDAAQMTELKAQIEALTAKIDKTPATTFTRPAATGADAPSGTNAPEGQAKPKW